MTKRHSGWASVRMRRQVLERTLQERHNLRLHGWLIGSATLLLMWGVSHAQMRWGVDSLALRYLVTLGVGYLGYLCVLRLWAAWLLKRREDESSGMDLGDAADAIQLAGDLGGAASRGLGDLAGGALEAVGAADEGAIVVVPVVVLFLIGAALLFGAGALALLYFGWDVLLAVAMELAFSAVAARAAMGVEREGWLNAAVRLTWKPLLGAVLCAVALGAALDCFVPQAHSLPQAVRLLKSR